MRRFRVGILTGGGDCPGLNAVIRAVTKSFILQCEAEVIGFEDGFLGMMERRSRPLSYRDVSGIMTQGGTILGTHNKANPFQDFRNDGADVSDEVVGTVAAIPLEEGTWELAKLAVATGARRRGIGRRLTSAAIEHARAAGARRLVLSSSHRLESAVRLYEAMGFRHTASHAGVAYDSADVFMELCFVGEPPRQHSGEPRVTGR